MSSRALALCGLLCASASGALATADASPTVELEEGSLIVSRVTPGGLIAWFGVARGSGGHVTSIHSRQGLVEANEQGTAFVELDEGSSGAGEIGSRLPEKSADRHRSADSGASAMAA